MQGDITAIADKNGNILVEYVYDSWGKLITMSGPSAHSISNKNPFLYRGYYYDFELGLYYLNSRYYDPVTKRFINADGYASTGQDFVGNNMFAYCGNNPVFRADSSGQSWGYLIVPIVIWLVTQLSGCAKKAQNNCYSHALRLENDPKTGESFDEKPQPGKFSGNALRNKELAGKGPGTAKEILEEKISSDTIELDMYFVEVDSADAVPSDGGWLIAMAYDISSGRYHFWRKEDDGTWSHKPGLEKERKTDWSGNIIYDPKSSDKDIYDQFLGYYEVGPF